MTASPGARLRALMAEGIAFAPFVFDGLQAKLAVQAGFRAVYMTGFGTAASWGLPDMGLLGRAEMSANAARIAAATSVPVIADADTGYGDETSVGHTVRVYERAGVAAMHIEDQEWPKRCGFLDGKTVIPTAEMVDKVKAALAARSDPDFVIIARTDAYSPNGWDDAMERGRMYHAAGADIVFVDGLKRVEEVHRAARDLEGIPQLLNSLFLTPEEARDLDFKIYIHIGTLMRYIADFRDSLAELRTTGRIALAEGDDSVKPVTRLLSGDD
jgi:2-methylisocitrate lyase-like PEP mutase family enzyme